MKTIIMDVTLPLICPSQKEIQELFDKGFVLKSKETFKYLVKDEVL